MTYEELNAYLVLMDKRRNQARIFLLIACCGKMLLLSMLIVLHLLGRL